MRTVLVEAPNLPMNGLSGLTLPIHGDSADASAAGLASAHLGLDVSDAYLDACAALVKAPAHRTRFKVQWTSAQIAEVDDVVRTCPWFDGYTFDA